MIKKIINIIIYKIIDLITFNYNKLSCANNELVIIKLDAIGDYILFRNFFKTLYTSNKFSNSRITLIGNIIWKDLASALDTEYIHYTIWLDTNKFINEYSYRYSFIKKIKKNKYNTLINAEYSRNFIVSDWIANSIYAVDKFAHFGDHSNSKIWQKFLSNSYYTNLFFGSRDVIFEFFRNKYFIEHITNEKCFIKRPNIDLNCISKTKCIESNYVIFFLGSSKKNNKWDSKSYAKVANYINEKYNYEIVLCGGNNDIEESKIFSKFCKFEYTDLIGKTTILELISIISCASLIISNETSAPHFSVALDVNTIVLYSGNHFGRFVPYPNSLTNAAYKCIYHPLISSDENYYKKLSNTSGYTSQLNINEISIKQVINEVDKYLPIENIINCVTGDK